MPEDKPKGKNVLPSTDLLDSSSDAALLQFLSKWAEGGLEPTSDSTSQPAALSTFCELEALGDSSPAFDLDPDNDTPEVPKPGNQVNRYVMLSQLGEGGMGEVFLAFDRDLRRHVALKSVRDGVDERQLWRFLKEAQVLAQLGHPNIVTVYEMGVTNEKLPYYTMPVVQGSTLHHILQLIKGKDPGTLRSFSMTRLMQVFLQVALALEYAHFKGVVHRDIKPANIMIGEHGEVLLLDWGVAKLMGETELETEACADITQSGHAVGTPTYMSPEQVSGGAVDARSDVYALGTLLYEMLTLEPPFRGSLVGVMSAHLNDAPKAPRARAPERNIPLELEKACLRALAKSPADRHQSARELHDEIQNWLEAAADKTQRFERARELASQGKTLLDDYNSLRKQIADADRQIEDVRQRFDAWQSVDEKSELFAAEDEAAGLRRKLSERASEVVMTLSAALGQDQEHGEARRLMADFYWERFLEAESRHDLEGRDFFEKLLRSFRDGRYEKELEGVGSIRITSTPPGATVTLHRLEERNVVSIPTERTELGLTPVTATPVPMASYLATLAKEGHQETRYPIWISRNQRWEGSVKLFKKDAIPHGFVHIPAGPFVAGGDDELRGWSLPASRPTLDDFFISVHPVTLREYLEFLEDLARKDSERALRRAPRRSPDGGYYFSFGEDGRLSLPRGADRSRWRPALPVVSISWHDSVAFCAWRSSRDGFHYRLPSELEWEKAARGVDGRWYPWGNRFDPSLCNMGSSLKKGPSTQPLDAFPLDRSIYGVRGAAGNVRDWTATGLAKAEADERDLRIVRGGAFNLPAVITRTANRFWLAPNFVLNYVGFRLACTP